LLKQKIDVGLVLVDNSILVIPDVLLDDRNDTVIVDVSMCKHPVMAVHPSVGDWAYGEILFDRKSIDYLKHNLTKIPDYLARTVVWRHLPFNNNRNIAPKSEYRQFYLN